MDAKHEVTHVLAHLVRYEITEQQIADLRAEFSGLTFDSPERYDQGRRAIATVRSLRTGVEKRRKELKADSLEYGRTVDRVAKHFTELLEAIEGPLQSQKDAVDNERERLKREAEMAEMIALEARLKAEREAEEAKAREERAAAEARLRVESARLAEVEAAQRAERAKLDAERKALADERHAIEADQRKAARDEAHRQQLERVAAEAAAQAERDAIAAEQAVADAAAEAIRIEGLRPDIEKVRAFGMAIRLIIGGAPALESPAGAEAIAWAVGRLENVAGQLDRFVPRKAA